MPTVSDLQVLLRSLQPVLNPGQFVFASLQSSAAREVKDAVAFIREPEGLSVVLEESNAKRYGVLADRAFAWITLSVNSDLLAVGLTAAVSSALSHAGISCNVVAGTHHDHLFVPVDRAATAMAELRALQQAANSASSCTE